MNKELKCCFIGHRKIERSKELEDNLYNLLTDLIINKGVSTFLFGSNSEFDNLCLEIISKLKTIYAHIKRIKYTCKSEGCFLLEHKLKWEEFNRKHNIPKTYDSWFEEEFHFKNKIKAGKASYVERNEALINDSNFCIFYYDKNYSKQKSGTKLAYIYAMQKKKQIFNMFK